MNVITMTAWHRPNYTQMVVDALRLCIGIRNYTLYVHVEPDDNEVIKILQSIDFMDKQVTINSVRLGGPTNSYNALCDGFSHGDFVIHIEDDICLSFDALQYFQYCDSKYRNEKEVFTITAFYRNNVYPEKENYHKLRRLQHYTSWAWATWSDRWSEIESDWDFNYSKPTIVNGQPVKFPDRGWDINIDHKTRRDRYEIFPLLTRCLNIGRENGLHVKPQMYDKDQYSKYHSGNVENLEQGEYHE